MLAHRRPISTTSARTSATDRRAPVHKHVRARQILNDSTLPRRLITVILIVAVFTIARHLLHRHRLYQRHHHPTRLSKPSTFPSLTQISPTALLVPVVPDPPSLSNLSVIPAAPHTLQFLASSPHGPRVLHLSPAGVADRVPCLHRLATLLSLEHVVAPRTYFWQSLPATSFDRVTARTMRRLARGTSALSATLLQARAIASGVHKSPSPYDWRSTLRTAMECHSVTHSDMVMQCRRVVQKLIVLYVGGCAPFGDGGLLLASEDKNVNGKIVLGMSTKCFSDWSAVVTRDLLIRYMAARCEIPHGLAQRLAALSKVQAWGIGSRAKEVTNWIEQSGTANARFCTGRHLMVYNG